MSNTIKKFTESLEKNIKILQNNLTMTPFTKPIGTLMEKDNLLIDQILQRINLKRFINGQEEQSEIYIDFSELSSILNETNLKVREKAEIIIFILKKNLEKLNNGFNINQLSNYQFKYTNFNEVKNLLLTNHYQQLCNNKLLSEIEILKLEEIKKVLEINNQMIEQHKLIKEHYFDKYPNIDTDDLKFIVTILKDLNIDKKLLDEIKGYFISTIEKNIQQNKLQKPIIKKENSAISLNTKNISEKEYNYYNRQLKQYYNLDTGKTIRTLSLNEQITCVCILQKMKIENDKINEILYKINKLNSKNPISIYIQMYDKYNYYKSNKKIENILYELDNYFKLIFISNDEDYELIKMFFEDGINEIKELIPKNYEYEYQKAKELKI